MYTARSELNNHLKSKSQSRAAAGHSLVCDHIAESTYVDTTKGLTTKASFGGRAWRLLRQVVLWPRRGSAVQSLRLLKTLRWSGIGHGRGLGGRRGDDRLRYGERQFSIDETPAFRFRTPSRVLRFILCVAPAVPDTPGVDRYFFSGAHDRAVDADYAGYCYYDGEPSEYGVEGHDDGADEQLLERGMMEESCANDNVDAAVEGGGDAGVDVKAEEFIAKFYSQMNLQRPISWLQYNEMTQRSLC